jgi:hypothetical protein
MNPGYGFADEEQRKLDQFATKQARKTLQNELHSELMVRITQYNENKGSLEHIQMHGIPMQEASFVMTNDATGAEVKGKWLSEGLEIIYPDGSHNLKPIRFDRCEMSFADPTTTMGLANELVVCVASRESSPEVVKPCP